MHEEQDRQEMNEAMLHAIRLALNVLEGYSGGTPTETEKSAWKFICRPGILSLRSEFHDAALLAGGIIAKTIIGCSVTTQDSGLTWEAGTRTVTTDTEEWPEET